MSSTPRTKTSRSSDDRNPCISLPVLGGGATGASDATSGTAVPRVKKSRAATWRGIVLGLIQVAIIAHILQWYFGGPTVSPVEPSEAMQFSHRGIINAGAILFAIAMLSTLIFGRWFCGWACHLVMLQDLCGVLLRKMGIRPKPFRSRLLIYVPFLLALYMFVMPFVYRWGLIPIDGTLESSLGPGNPIVETVRGGSALLGYPLPPPPLPEWKPELDVITDDFWRTFPGGRAGGGRDIDLQGLMLSVPFLLICGFATVYFLGNKGFCTYGCPYGGFFAPLDQLAPGRIRVTDDCEHCGHCTAVCTSNVRVHEEVRDFGMVVDPGCMKCMDCVSVCPNDALYFGFGRPEVSRRETPTAKVEPRTPDFSWRGELALGLIFFVSFMAFRSDLFRIPLLMVAGTAAVITFLAWTLWTMVSQPNVHLLRWRLKLKGRVQRTGWIFVVLAGGAVGFVGHLAVGATMAGLASIPDGKVTAPRWAVFAAQPQVLPPDMADAAEDSIRWWRRARPIWAGGLSPIASPKPYERLAWLHACRHEYADAEAMLRESRDRFGANQNVARDLAQLLRMQGRPEEAAEFTLAEFEQHPEFVELLGDHTSWLITERGQPHRAAQLARQGLARQQEGTAEELYMMRLLSLHLLDIANFEEAIALIERTIEIDPNNANAHATLSRAYVRYQQPDRRSVRFDAPSSWRRARPSCTTNWRPSSTRRIDRWKQTRPAPRRRPCARSRSRTCRRRDGRAGMAPIGAISIRGLSRRCHSGAWAMKSRART